MRRRRTEVKNKRRGGRSISKERKKCTKTQRERGQGGVFQAHDEKIHKFGQGSGVSEVQETGGQTSSTNVRENSQVSQGRTRNRHCGGKFESRSKHSIRGGNPFIGRFGSKTGHKFRQHHLT